MNAYDPFDPGMEPVQFGKFFRHYPDGFNIGMSGSSDGVLGFTMDRWHHNPRLRTRAEGVGQLTQLPSRGVQKEKPASGMNQGLLLIDMQNDYFQGGAMELVGMAAAANRAVQLLKRFRRESAPVYFVQHLAIRPGATFFLPETNGARYP